MVFCTRLISHFNRKTCLPAHSCSFPVSQSCGSGAIHHADNHAVTGQELHFTSTIIIEGKKCDLCEFDFFTNVGFSNLETDQVMFFQSLPTISSHSF